MTHIICYRKCKLHDDRKLFNDEEELYNDKEYISNIEEVNGKEQIANDEGNQ